MTATLDTVLEIETPEHLAFRTRIAGPGRRMVAWLIDLLVRCVLMVLAAFALQIVGSMGIEGFSQGLLLFIAFILDWLYFTAWELTSGGRSAGKIALNLRVVRLNGLPITWRESILRNFVRAADITIAPPAILLLGPMVMALDDKFRRLGDMVAGTIVIAEDTAEITPKVLVEPDPEAMTELPGHLPLDRTDLEALELFVHRTQVSSARRNELAEIVAGIYAKRLGLAAPRDPSAFLGALWAATQGKTTSESIE